MEFRSEGTSRGQLEKPDDERETDYRLEEDVNKSRDLLDAMLKNNPKDRVGLLSMLNHRQMWECTVGNIHSLHTAR